MLSPSPFVVAAAATLASLAAAEPDASLAHHELLQRSVHDGSWALETRGLLDDFGTCGGCESILSLLKGLVKTDDSALTGLGTQLCAIGTPYDSQFCNGTVAREAPVIAELLRSIDINSTSSTQFCITFLGVCKYPDVAPWTVPVPSKKACNDKAPAVSGKKPLKVIHYSDIHIDPLYVAGSSTQCKKPTCCRPFTEDDEPGKSKSPAGPNGDHNCDSPVTLEDSMYKAIHDMFPDQAFTIFTGDIVDHGLFNTSKPYNQQEITDAYSKMNNSFKTVYGTAGNHESDPANIFYPNSQNNKTQWVYDSLSSEWSHWISSTEAQSAKSIGAYSAKYPKGNLRIISLNTNMYYRFNFALYQKDMQRDPNDQIAWLAKELDAAEKAGENVYIIGHMPFGEADALRDQSNYLDQVVRRYATTIRAMFFGHTHLDHFEVSYADYSKRSAANAFAMSYICPSLTPTSGMPSFRVYDVDPDTFAVLDATTYYADMGDSAFQTSGPVWKKYYSAKEAYGAALKPAITDPAAELTPAFWHNVTAAFETNSTLFDEYMARKSRGWNVEKPCRDSCRDTEICQLRAGRSQDNCQVPTPGVHFSKRDMSLAAQKHGEHDDCGAPVIRDVFHALARRTDLLEMLQKRFVAEGAVVEPVVRRSPVPAESAAASPTPTDDADACVSTTHAGGASATKSSAAEATGLHGFAAAAAAVAAAVGGALVV